MIIGSVYLFMAVLFFSDLFKSPGARGRTDFSQKMREELLATVERL